MTALLAGKGFRHRCMDNACRWLISPLGVVFEITHNNVQDLFSLYRSLSANPEYVSRSVGLLLWRLSRAGLHVCNQRPDEQSFPCAYDVPSAHSSTRIVLSAIIVKCVSAVQGLRPSGAAHQGNQYSKFFHVLRLTQETHLPQGIDA